MEISRNEIKELRALQQKKYREERGLFIVEGEKMVQEALDSALEVVRVYRRDEIGPEAMARISALSTPSPALAVVRIPAPRPVSVQRGLCLALDGIRDPGNLGTILRLADWFGVDAVYASPDCVEAYNPKVIQASLGAIFRKQPIYCDIDALCEAFLKDGVPVLGTFLDGDDLYETALPREGLIVMGNEADGIRPEVARKVSARLLIPSFAQGPTAESLNVAVATAVVVSEIRRRGRNA